MSDQLKTVVVPKDLYYHEVAYVRRLEALLATSIPLIEKVNFLPKKKELKAKWDALLKEHLDANHQS